MIDDGAPQSGNIRYIVINQSLKWQHNWQQGGNRVATTGHLTARQAELGRPDGQGGLTTIWFALWRFTIIQRRKFSEQVPRMAKRKARILNREICEPREHHPQRELGIGTIRLDSPRFRVFRKRL